MTPLVSRAFLAVDEWGWLILCAVLLARGVEQRNRWPQAPNPYWWALGVVAVAGAVMVYGIAYPMLWALTGERFPW